MKPWLFVAVTFYCTCLAGMVVNANAQTGSDKPDSVADQGKVPITIDNFIRAATDIEFDKYVSLAGGVNRFYHFREPAPVDNQPTIRMNRDTLYSTAVVDISKGATLTLPEVGERYMTAMVVNQDHYINDVFAGGGTYPIDMKTFDTPYVIVYVRTLVDAADPKDVAAVNAIQDEMTVAAASSQPFIMPNYNKDRFEALVSTLLPLGAFVSSGSTGTFGAKENINPVRHLLGTALGWGGLPENETVYEHVEPALPLGQYKIEVPADVPVGAFWSISLYNAKGFFEANDRNAYNVNSVTGTRNDGGSMTVHFGGCEDDRVNCLPIMENWNYIVRMYRPGQEVLEGKWVFPAVEPVQ